MAFTILDNDEVFNVNQAIWMQTDINALVAGFGGDGVVSGCAVTAQGSPDMTLAVASGTISIAGAAVAVTSGNVTITTADATNPRIDLVVVSNAGAKSVTAGTAAANPKAPDIPANSILLAMVYVPANDTAIQTNQITDKRVIITAAPRSSKLVTTASDGLLSAEVAIPGLAGSPDILASGGAGTSREFEAGDTSPTFTSAPAETDVGVTVLSRLYVRTTDTTERFAYYAWSPAGAAAFDARCKCSLALNAITGGPDLSVMVANTGRTDRALVLLGLSAVGFGTIKAFTYTASTFTQRGSNIVTIPNGADVYYRITRDGSNNVSFYFSLNGIAWQLIATQSFTFTVGEIGWRFNNSSATEVRFYIDWLRADV